MQLIYMLYWILEQFFGQDFGQLYNLIELPPRLLYHSALIGGDLHQLVSKGEAARGRQVRRDADAVQARPQGGQEYPGRGRRLLRPLHPLDLHLSGARYTYKHHENSHENHHELPVKNLQ